MNDVGDSILRGVDEALAFARGERAGARVTEVRIPERVDVRRVRRALGLTQARFAARFGLRLDAVRAWEQGRLAPDRPSRVLLTVIARDADVVVRALAEGTVPFGDSPRPRVLN